MYNMNISIGSYKVRVEILIAIVVVFWIMFGHLLCGCCKTHLFEGFRMERPLARTRRLAREAREARERQEEAEIARRKAEDAVQKAMRRF